MALESLFGTGTIVAIVAISVVAGLAHGTIGFGFPVISTPLVALLTDVKTAILVTVVPNIAVNVISILRGGRWRESIGLHWPVAVAVVAGTLVGTRLLLVAPPEPLKVLLAAMILVYLQQERLRRLDWSWIARAPTVSGIGFGLVGGMLSGAVNVSAPPLIIYFMTLGLTPIAMTQVLNLCFIAGKVTQATNLGLSQAGGGHVLGASLPLTAIAVATVLGGMRVQSRLRPEMYRRLLRAVLWAMVFLLLAQVGWKVAHGLSFHGFVEDRVASALRRDLGSPGIGSLESRPHGPGTGNSRFISPGSDGRAAVLERSPRQDEATRSPLRYRVWRAHRERTPDER